MYQQQQQHQQTIPALLAKVFCYQDKARIQHDVGNLFRQMNSLRAQIGTRVTNDGRSAQLLSLVGTLPIHYRGAAYNIPVTIWIPALYPRQPPIVYVTPTPGMQVKPRHRHVDIEGLVYLPYLNQWNPNSTLGELCSMTSSVFSQDPPVYKVQSAPRANTAPVQRQAPSRSPPPYVAQPSPYAAQPSPSPSPSLHGVASPYAAPAPAYPTPVARPVETAGAREARLEAAKKKELLVKVTAKLKNDLKQVHTENTDKINQLFVYQSESQQGEEEIEKGVEQCTKQHSDLESAKGALTAQLKAVGDWVSANEEMGGIDVDKAVFMKDTWSKQALVAVAKDNAYEDTLNVLFRSMDDTVDVSKYLKEVRKLARKQFFVRALAIRISDEQLAMAGGRRVGLKG